MKYLLVAILSVVPALSMAQGVLAFRDDLAFEARAVEAVAERSYRARLQMFAADGRLDANPELLERLRGLIARLQRAAQFERPDASINWEIHTCRRCGENASAMAGGKLLIGEEFVAKLEFTDDELAYVLAHEMAHVLSEHAREFATNSRYVMGNGRNRDYWDIQNELDNSIAVNLHMAPLYVQQELEADYVGFILGARSGFDPEAMPRMLGKLQIESGAFFAAHPGEAQRMARALAMLETARRIRAMGLPALSP